MRGTRPFAERLPRQQQQQDEPRGQRAAHAPKCALINWAPAGASGAPAYFPRDSRALVRSSIELHLRHRVARMALRALQRMQIFLLKRRASASGNRAIPRRSRGG